MQKRQGKFTFQASWKDTYVYMTMPQSDASSRSTHVFPGACSGEESAAHLFSNTHAAACSSHVRRERRLKVANFFSDVLYQGHMCATHPISPHWLHGDNLPRRERLTAAEFQQTFERPGIPVVMKTGQYFERACSKWTADYLLQHLQGRTVIAGE